ncbi:hypothetical protein [Streptomyces sp. CA-253872]|uniref:hypothetical protein n=1 Tax=Streptomyces sp. CA-253872 TaxID=3240067 RepID=UPI003D8B595E
MHPDDITQGTPEGIPLTDAQAATEARRLIHDAYQNGPAELTATAYRDPAPVPPYGSTPAVVQPGRPPMSQRATDASALMLTGSVATLAAGGSASLVLAVLGTLDPVTLGVAGGGATAVLLALGALIRRAGRAAGDAARPEIHHHYAGPVTQQHTSLTTHTRGLSAHTHNHQH